MRIVECNQYSPEWWDARRGIPTASAFSRIVTAVKGQYASAASSYIAELIADRLNPWYGPTNDDGTSAMRTGTAMEPRVRALYELNRGCVEVQQVGFCTTDDGRLGCSPDSLVDDDGVLELKSPMPKTQVAYLLDGGLPSEYKTQCHGHLIVTGRKYCDFMSYADGLPELVVRVEPNDFTETMREALGTFLNDYDLAWKRIAEMLPPPPPPKIVTAPGFVPTEVPAYVSPF